ncbi:hypothetical protein GCM10023210_01980 [Chryseobacterium ginsengisoli]|uniref:Heme oxygenase n=1 Tax=Chryseobacterium ginsengisoli TaxID=363853 RepID=A0ABP9LRN4_9FLAO
MNTIRLYKFKDSISRKMQFLSKESNLDSLDDPIHSKLLDIEIVTEYIINISNDFIYEDLSYSELIHLCSSARKTIEHYFVKSNIDYDLI